MRGHNWGLEVAIPLRGYVVCNEDVVSITLFRVAVVAIPLRG